MKKLNLRSQRAVVAEANRVHRELLRLLSLQEGDRRRKPTHDHTVSHLLGAQQALAWALLDFAMSPTRAFAEKPRRRRK